MYTLVLCTPQKIIVFLFHTFFKFIFVIYYLKYLDSLYTSTVHNLLK